MILSIITINYNNLSGLQKTFDSIIEQSFKDFEWLVIDGGSTDGSKEFLYERSCYFSYLCSEKDNGVYDAMNKGILKSNGIFINFMNSGDIFHDNYTLEKIFKDKSYFEADILYGDNMIIKGETLEERIRPDILTLSYFFQGISICHQASFIRKVLFDNSLYDIKSKITADRRKWLLWLMEGRIYKHVPLFVADFDGSGMSSNILLCNKENQRDNEECVPIGIRKDIEELLYYRQKHLYYPELDQIFRYLSQRRIYKILIHITLKIIKLIECFRRF